MVCFVSSGVDMTLRSVCSGRSDDSSRYAEYMSRRGCRLTSRLSAHQRPTDRQALTAAVTSKRRRERSSTITRTRPRARQLHAGPTKPHPRLLPTSRVTAQWGSKETHPRPTDRRTSTEATSCATSRDSNKHHRPDPTRRLRVACSGDDTAACSAGHSHMSGDSRIVDSATHLCTRSPFDLAVASPSSRRLVRRRGSYTVRCRISGRSSTRRFG